MRRLKNEIEIHIHRNQLLRWRVRRYSSLRTVVEALTWNTAPGVMNSPTPPSNDPLALDPADLTDVLLTFAGPGQTGVRFSKGYLEVVISALYFRYMYAPRS